MKFKLNLLILIFIISMPSVLIAQEIKIIHGPYIQAMGEHEVTIVWTTNLDAVSWVELAPAGNNSFYAGEMPQYYETMHGNRVVDRLHKICLPKLEKATEYRYRIFSKEVLKYEGGRILYGNIASTDVYRQKPLHFKTLDKGKNEVSFIVVNDIHEKADSLKALLKNVKYGSTDLVIFNGDLVSNMINEKQFFDGFMDASVDLFASEVPMFFARGNHETRGPFSVKFSEYFPTSSGKLYYTFRQGPVFFVVLDGGEDKPDSDIEYSGLAQYDAYRSEQKDWLEKVVLTDEFKSAPYRVVILHIPLIGSDWHETLDLNQKLLPVLNKACISIMLSGHTHRYKFIEPKANELNFPIFINAPNTSLEINADNQSMVIQRKNTNGKVVDKHVIPKLVH